MLERKNKQFKARKRSMLFKGYDDYWAAWKVIHDLDLDYEEKGTEDNEYNIITLELTLPQFMTVEKIFKAKKIKYSMFRN